MKMETGEAMTLMGFQYLDRRGSLKLIFHATARVSRAATDCTYALHEPDRLAVG